MMRVKDDERDLEAVKDLYERVMKALENIAKKYNISLEAFKEVGLR